MSRTFPTSAEQKNHPAADSASAIDKTLFLAQKKVRHVDITVSVFLFFIGLLLFFFVAVLLDHWLPGGLGFFGRAFLWLTFLAGIYFFIRQRILPLVLFRVHPLYAAAVVEENLPEIKNSLLNLIFLRREFSAKNGAGKENREELLNRKIFSSLENQTAAKIQHVELGATVDHVAVLRSGYLFVGIFALCCVYFVISPKDTFASVGRVLWPWAKIAAPTRVVFYDLQPGDATIFQGETLSVSVNVRNLTDTEPVTLFYSTQDGQVRGFPVEMRRDGKAPHFRAELGGDSCPGIPSGIQQELSWFLTAGDCISPIYHVYVKPVLSISVREIAIFPPEYTGIPASRQKMADIKAPEGTRVEIFADTNHPVAEAQLVLRSSDPNQPAHRVEMFPVSGENAGETTQVRGVFTLNLPAVESHFPEFTFYQIRFRTPDGKWSKNGAKYRIQIIPDMPPAVRLLEAPEDGGNLPINRDLSLFISAEDADYALRGVAFYAEWNGKLLKIPPILNIPVSEKKLPRTFQTAWRWSPAEYRLRPGDQILWWVEVADNRLPAANRVRTEKRLLNITAPEDADGEKPVSPRKDGNQTEEKMRTPVFRPGEPESEKTPPEKMTDFQNPENAGDTPSGENTSGKTESHAGNDRDRTGNKRPGNTDEENTGDGNASAENEAGEDDGNSPPESGVGTRGNSGEKSETEDSSGENEGIADSETPGKKENGGKSGEKPDSKTERGTPGENSGNGESSENRTDENSPPLAPKNYDPLAPRKAAEKNPENSAEKNPEQNTGNENRGNSSERDPKEKTGGKQESPKTGEKTKNPSGKEESTDENGAGEDGAEENSGKSGESGSEKTGGEPSGAGEKAPRGENGNETHTKNESSAGDEGDENGNLSKSTTSAQPRKIDPVTDPGTAFEEILRDHQNADASETGDSSESDSSGSGESPESLNSPGVPPGKEKPQKGTDKTPADKFTAAESPQISDDAEESSDLPPSEISGTGEEPNSTQHGSDHSPDTEPPDVGKHDNKGGNRSGGDNASDQEGTGRAGQNTPNEKGAPIGHGGDGPDDKESGNKKLTSQNTGVSDPEKRSGNGIGTKPAEAAKTAENSPPRKPGENPSSGTGTGNGFSADATPDSLGSGEVAAADEANLEFAKKQTILALEHLRHELKKDDPAILKNLGWSREEAEAFLKKWQALHKNAEKSGKNQNASRETLSRSLRNLGLRPATVSLSPGTYTESKRPEVRGSLRVSPPDAWAEQYEAFSKGVAGGLPEK